MPREDFPSWVIISIEKFYSNFTYFLFSPKPSPGRNCSISWIGWRPPLSCFKIFKQKWRRVVINFGRLFAIGKIDQNAFNCLLFIKYLPIYSPCWFKVLNLYLKFRFVRDTYAQQKITINYYNLSNYINSYYCCTLLQYFNGIIEVLNL